MAITNLYQYYQSLGQALPSWQQRRGIAGQAGISNYTGTASQNTQLLNYLQGQTGGQFGNQGYQGSFNLSNALATGNNIISAGALGGSSLTTPTTSNYSSLMQRLEELRNKPYETLPEQTKVSEYETQLENLLKSYTGQEKYKQQLMEQEGATRYEQELKDMENTIRMKEASLRAGLVDVEGKPIPMQAITGQQAEMKRQAAIELEGLSAVYEVKRGDLEAAYKKVENKFNLKYEPIKEQIDLTSKLLNLNYNKLTKAEKKQADQRQTELDNLTDQLKVAQKEEEDAYKLEINPGDYSNSEIKKLRYAGIDATNTSMADNYLYGRKAPKGKGAGAGESLSINQIAQFKNLYGWTPPFGYTQSQLLKYMKDNPGATPEELEAGANQVKPPVTPTVPTAPKKRLGFFARVREFFRKGIRALIPKKEKDQIQEALNAGYTQEEIELFFSK